MLKPRADCSISWNQDDLSLDDSSITIRTNVAGDDEHLRAFCGSFLRAVSYFLAPFRDGGKRWGKRLTCSNTSQDAFEKRRTSARSELSIRSPWSYRARMGRSEIKFWTARPEESRGGGHADKQRRNPRAWRALPSMYGVWWHVNSGRAIIESANNRCRVRKSDLCRL